MSLTLINCFGKDKTALWNSCDKRKNRQVDCGSENQFFWCDYLVSIEPNSLTFKCEPSRYVMKASQSRGHADLTLDNCQPLTSNRRYTISHYNDCIFREKKRLFEKYSYTFVLEWRQCQKKIVNGIHISHVRFTEIETMQFKQFLNWV